MTRKQAQRRLFAAFITGVEDETAQSESNLAQMLTECEQAHRLSGEPDADWAKWYARWLLGYIITPAIDGEAFEEPDSLDTPPAFD